MGRDLDAEGLAVLVGVGGAGGVRRDEERRRTSAAHEPQRPLAEGRRIDQKIPALLVVDDVLTLVLERLVELEDPRAQLMDVHGAGLS